MNRKKSNKINIQKLDWDKLKNRVSNVNRELAGIINENLPKGNPCFYLASYRYGTSIFKNGKFLIPTDGCTTAVFDDYSSPIKKDLEYCYLPIGLILNKSVEVFAEANERSVPSKMFEPGDLFGLWEWFDPSPNKFVKSIWNLSAGARTTFLLPKVSDNEHHNHLMKKAKVNASAPKKMLDHYYVFRDIAKTRSPKWICEIMLFPKQWLTSPLLEKIENFFLKEAWRQSYNCRIQMSGDLAWENFSFDVTNRGWKPKAATINIIKHLLSIESGVFPGFAPAENEDALPTKAIQQAYLNDYRLRHYAPIIMKPTHFKNKQKNVYYSLAIASLLESLIKPRNAPRPIDEMREIKLLIDLMKKHQLGEGHEYNCYHCEPDRERNIYNTTQLFKDDTIIAKQCKVFNRKFPMHSPFFRGVIRISR